MRAWSTASTTFASATCASHYLPCMHVHLHSAREQPSSSMVRFHWHVEDGFGAFIPPCGMVPVKDTKVQTAIVEIEVRKAIYG